MREKGATLAELLVAAALLQLVLVGLFAFYAAGSRFFETGVLRAELQQHARLAVEELAYELFWANNVVANVAGKEIRYLKKVDGALKPYRFYLTGSQLLLGLPGGTSVPVACFIEDLLIEPGGVLPAGAALGVAVVASCAGQSVTLSVKILPRNTGEY